MIVSSTARLRYVSIPPRKMRLVAEMVKGLPVQKALDLLNFTPKIAAKHIANTVKSAAANALSSEGTDVLKAEDLLIKNITVDPAPSAKRIRYQSMGRVFRYKKRFCHLTVLLEGVAETEPVAARPKKKGKAARGEASTDDARAAGKSAKSKAKPKAGTDAAGKTTAGKTSKSSTKKTGAMPEAKNRKTKKDGE